MNNHHIILLVSTLVSLVSAYSVCCVQNTVTYCNFAKFDCITMGRKRSLKIYYQNLGLGRVKNKLTQVETILPEIRINYTICKMEFYLAQHKYICNLQSNLTQLRKTQFKQPHITNSHNKMASK